jgi:hypothetical protein
MTWNDISVKKWIQIQTINKDCEELQSLLEILSIIHEKPIKELKNLPINGIVEMRIELEELLKIHLDDGELLREFKSGGFNFRFPDLNRDWIFAKNIDLENYSKDIRNFHICLSILYYPKDIEYETTKAIELSKLIELEPISKLYPAWNLFFLFTMDYVKITGNYSLLMMMTESTRVMMKVLNEPEKLPVILRRLLLKKLKGSGQLSESLIRSLTIGSNNGNTFSNSTQS